MKYTETDKVFLLRVGGKLERVKPYNGEEEGIGPSWSHGFTHLKDENGNRNGFCGIIYFEKNAKEVS